MRIRDAVEADAGRLAALSDSPTDVMRNLIHDRTVRVADTDEPTASDGTDAADRGDGAPTAVERPTGARGEILGFVSFDVRDRTVHVTQIEGSAAACERLLDEPVAFAREEGMDVEILVPETETTPADAAEAAGFRNTGRGPRFEGSSTVRYRLDPTETDGRTGGIRDA